MAELYCPCPERHKLWGEFWWVGGKHQWVFFDDLKTSETYAEQVECCPACGHLADDLSECGDERPVCADCRVALAVDVPDDTGGQR